MADKAYKITRTQPTIYLDDLGGAVNGYLVTVHLTEFDEVHQVRVASQKPEETIQAITQLLEWRTALSEL